MIGEGLTCVDITQQHGVVHAAGFLVDSVYYQRSSDGATLEAFQGGSTSRYINAAVEGKPALEVLPTGRIVVVVDNGDGLAVYASDTGGETWTGIDIIN